VLKAVDYLIKSGEKCLKKFSLEESHGYFKKAFDILISIPEKSDETHKILVGLQNRMVSC
jgi:hypothetical protein